MVDMNYQKPMLPSLPVKQDEIANEQAIAPHLARPPASPLPTNPVILTIPCPTPTDRALI